MHLEIRLLHWNSAGTEIAFTAAAARSMQLVDQ
jgi:hypothetical protein